MLELAFLVWGIIILTKRKFQLSSRKVVTGMPAILVGIMFVSLLPLGFVMGIILGVVMALNGGLENLENGNAENMWIYAVLINVGLIVGAFVIAVLVAVTKGKDPRELEQAMDPYQQYPQQPVPPRDPNNPYSSPPNDW